MELRINEHGHEYVEIRGVFDGPIQIYYQKIISRVIVDVPDCGCCGSVNLLSFFAYDPPSDNEISRVLVAKALEAVQLLQSGD